MKIVYAPSSKSLSHRTLICAALSDGNSNIYNLLDCDDTRKTMAVLEKAGVQFTSLKGDIFKDFSVRGVGKSARGAQTFEDAKECYIGESGTSARLLTAILSSGSGYFKVCGAKRMHERPMGAIIEALRTIGAEISTEKEGYAPLIIHAKRLVGGKCEIALDESSQYLSGLLLLAPLCEKGLELYPSGTKAVSWPYVALTLQSLEKFGIQFSVKNSDGTLIDNWAEIQEIRPNSLYIEVKSGNYASGNYTVEGDWSGASYLLAAGALGKNPVKVMGLNIHSAQGDKVLLEILKKMGAKVEISQESVTVFPSQLNGIEIDMNSCPDIVPTVAALAACAHGITHISNVPHLRVKESDRIATVVSELSKIGIEVEELEEGMIIHGNGKMPSPQNTILFSSHNDHRIAMSMALFSLHNAKIDFDEKEVVKKSFPDFWQVFENLL